MEKKSDKLKCVVEEKSDRGSVLKITLPQFSLYFGGSIIFMAVVVFVVIYWGQWETRDRVLATLPPSLLFYLAAWKLSRSLRKLAHFCAIVACSLLPLSLALIFREMGFSGTHMGLATSLTTLLCYVISVWLIDVSALTSFSAASGYFFYYYLLKSLGVESFGKAMSLLFLLPCAAFLSAGAWHEQIGRIKDCRRLYFSAIIVFFAMMLQWARMGSFLDAFAGKDAIGLSLALVAVLFLLTALFIEKAKRYRLDILAEYSDFLKVFGVLFFMGAFLWLSCGGEKPVYETVLLLSSLAFIFLGTWRQSKTYLNGGALYLIIYIFCIGGKYFQTKTGWPLTLLVAGILSIAIGLGTGMLKKKYFRGSYS